MRKTGGEIELDVFNLLVNSGLKTALSGSVYSSGARPANSTVEDAVVSFLTGLDGDIQTGIVNVNVYVPNVYSGTKDGATVKNTSRCREIEIVVNNIIQSNSMNGDYLFELDKMIQTYEVVGLGQHFVNCRIKFRLSTY